MGSDGPILVVDDDTVSRHVLGETLAGAGLSVVELAGGAEALAWLEQQTPAVVLLDLVMPDPDGYAVLRHLRASSRLADIPVVVLTALDSNEEIRRVFSSGADDYVHKPFRPAELVGGAHSQGGRSSGPTTSSSCSRRRMRWCWPSRPTSTTAGR